MTLPPVDVLGVVPPALLAPGGRVDRLAVDTRRGAGVIRLLPGADLLAEEVMNGVEGSVGPPPVEVTPDGALGGQVAGQVSPLATGAEDVEDGVQDIPHLGLARPPAAGFGRNM